MSNTSGCLTNTPQVFEGRITWLGTDFLILEFLTHAPPPSSVPFRPFGFPAHEPAHQSHHVYEGPQRKQKEKKTKWLFGNYLWQVRVCFNHSSPPTPNSSFGTCGEPGLERGGGGITKKMGFQNFPKNPWDQENSLVSKVGKFPNIYSCTLL